MITLIVNGSEFEGFTRINASRSYSAVPGSFSFVATTSPEDLTTFPIAEGDACKVMIDGAAFITGYVDQIEVSHSDDAHEIAVQGRSRIADLTDSTMDGTFEIKGPMPLNAALKQIITLAGIPEISVIDNTGGGLTPFTLDDNLSGKIGDQVWSLMASLAIKKSVLLTEDGDGNVVITRGEGETISDQLIKIPDGAENNIKNSSVRHSMRERFYKYLVVSQDDSASMANITINNLVATETTDKLGIAFDSEMRSTRNQCLMAEKASNPADCIERATWQANYNAVKSFSYSCQVQGFTTDSGEPFAPGMMPHVIDEFMQIDSDLIIDSVELSYSQDDGSNTALTFVLPDAFTLQATTPQPSNSGNDVTGILS